MPVRDKVTDEIVRRTGLSRRQAERVRDKMSQNGHSTDDLIERLEPLTKQRLKKMIVETDLAGEKLKIVRRDTIPVEEARTIGIKLGTSLSEFAGDSIANWPGELAGFNEIQIREHLVKMWEAFIEQFRATVKRI